eukprot:ctg_897.g375
MRGECISEEGQRSGACSEHPDPPAASGDLAGRDFGCSRSASSLPVKPFVLPSWSQTLSPRLPCRALPGKRIGEQVSIASFTSSGKRSIQVSSTWPPPTTPHAHSVQRKPQDHLTHSPTRTRPPTLHYAAWHAGPTPGARVGAPYPACPAAPRCAHRSVRKSTAARARAWWSRSG